MFGGALWLLVPAVVVVIRAGSRAVYIIRHGPIGQLQGPLILPSDDNNELFYLSQAFRHCVGLPQNADAIQWGTIVTTTSNDITKENLLAQATLQQRQDALLQQANKYRQQFNTPPTQSRTIYQRIKQILRRLQSKDDESVIDPPISVISHEKDSAITRMTVFAPKHFQNLRKNFGISESDYLASLLRPPYVSFQSNSKGAARVGGVFFFSLDGAYMCKTIKRDEVDTLLQMLPRYSKFMQKNGRRSLLTRFCGLYEIELPNRQGKIEQHTFVVMNSVFPPESSLILTERFDLKGSTLGRECSADERIRKGSHAVLKDLDLAHEVELMQSLANSIDNHGFGIDIGPRAKSALLNQLRRDVSLLVDCQVMDYSLLVGVAKLDSAKIQPEDVYTLQKSYQEEAEIAIQQDEASVKSTILAVTLAPLKSIAFVPLSMAKIGLNAARKVCKWPLPYYGSGTCGVNAGSLSKITGRRLGTPAIYYMGLIDFLQPFNEKKRLEWRLKSVVYGNTFSCVPPAMYASRFLTFINKYFS